MTNSNVPEGALEEMSVKQLMAQQNAYLFAIYQEVCETGSDPLRMFECDMCHAEVVENERENHMLDEHGAHGSMDIMNLYTEV